MRLAHSKLLIFSIASCALRVSSVRKRNHPTAPPNWRRQLRDLSRWIFPGFDGIEVAVAAQLRAARDSLYNESKEVGTTNQRLGIAYGNTGSDFHAYSILDTALACYRNAALLQPKDFRWHHLSGITLAEMNKPYEALDSFKRAVELEPKYLPSHVRAGEILFVAKSRWGLRPNHMSRLPGFHPKNPRFSTGLHKSLMKKESLNPRRIYIKRSSIYSHEQRVFATVLALAYRKLGQPGKAREQLELQGPVGVKVADPLLKRVESRRNRCEA